MCLVSNGQLVWLNSKQSIIYYEDNQNDNTIRHVHIDRRLHPDRDTYTTHNNYDAIEYWRSIHQSFPYQHSDSPHWSRFV